MHHLDPDKWERLLLPKSSSIVSSLAADTTDANGAIRVQYGSSVKGYSRTQGIDADLTIIRKFTGMRLALLALDMQGVIMSSMLTAPLSPKRHQDQFLRAESEEDVDHHYASFQAWSQLLDNRALQDGPATPLGASEDGRAVLERMSTRASQWWEEVMHGLSAAKDGGRGIGLGAGVMGRSDSSMMGTTADAGEYAVIVATLVSVCGGGWVAAGRSSVYRLKIPTADVDVA
jgi:hypothetical protein